MPRSKNVSYSQYTISMFNVLFVALVLHIGGIGGYTTICILLRHARLNHVCVCVSLVRTCLIMNATRVKDKTRIYCLFLFSFPFVLHKVKKV